MTNRARNFWFCDVCHDEFAKDVVAIRGRKQIDICFDCIEDAIQKQGIQAKCSRIALHPGEEG